MHYGNDTAINFKMNESDVYTWGHNGWYEYGNGSGTQLYEPFKSSYSHDHYICGMWCCWAIKDGYVYGVGYNSGGFLGTGSTENSIQNYKQVTGLSGIVQGDCGQRHCLFLKNDGTVYSVGQNGAGQCGLGNTSGVVTTATKINGLNNVKQVGASTNKSYALTKDGKLYFWGQKKLGTSENITSPELLTTDVLKMFVCYEAIFIKKYDGNYYVLGDGTNYRFGNGSTSSIDTPTLLNFDKQDEIVKIMSSANATFILCKDGTLWGSGKDDYGYFLRSTSGYSYSTFTEIVDGTKDFFFTGQTLFLIQSNNDKLYSVGGNMQGMLGRGYTDHSYKTKVRATLSNINSYTVSEIPGQTNFPEWYFSKVKYLVKYNGNYYTINSSNTLVQVTGSITKDVIDANGVELSVIQNNLSTIPSDFVLVSDGDFTISITGIRDQNYLVVDKTDFDIPTAKAIENFTATYTQSGVGTVKLAFSTDEGQTWNTYDGSVLSVLPITIPLKDVSELTDAEKLQWEEAKNVINTSGMSVSTLSTVDLTGLHPIPDKIRFAYVAHVEKTSDRALLKNLTLNYEDAVPYKIMKEADYDLELDMKENKIKVTPSIDAHEIRVNVMK